MENTAIIKGTGKHYDVALESMGSVASAPSLRSTGRNIDGFFRPRITASPRRSIGNMADTTPDKAIVLPSAPELGDIPTPKMVAKHASAGRTVNHTRAHRPEAAKSRSIQVSHTAVQAQKVAIHRQSNHVRHRAIQHSQTLRRDSVPTPEISTYNLLKPRGTLEHAVPSSITPKKSIATIDPDRLVRASSASRSPLIAHHAAPSRAILPAFVPMAMQPTPTPTTPPVAPPPTPGNDGVPPAPAPQPDNKPTDIFEHALANASNYVDLHAHKQRYQKKARTHVASMTLGSLALIIMASFIAYQNSAALQLKVASVRAGISAHMPNFAAAGFTYKGVHANNSRLTFGFQSNNGTYQLTQTTTNLSDTDMIQAIGSTDASGTPAYQVVMAGNTIVYRFSNNNATWVSNGKWYTVSGTNNLTNQQVTAIVQHV